MWQNIFSDIEYQDLFTAFNIWFATEQFPPMPANLNELIKRHSSPECFISAEKAWEMVDLAVRKFGSYNQDKAEATFSDPIKRAVRNVGGWQKICQTELGQSWEFLRKNFISAYKEFNSENREQIMLPESILHRLQEMTNQKQLEHKK
jgi:hypothetical protein